MFKKVFTWPKNLLNRDKEQHVDVVATQPAREARSTSNLCAIIKRARHVAITSFRPDPAVEEMAKTSFGMPSLRRITGKTVGNQTNSFGVIVSINSKRTSRNYQFLP